MRGVDHDRLSKFSPDRSRRCFSRIGGAKHVADLAHGIDTLVNNCDRFFRSTRIALVRRTFARLSASHKFDDAFPVLAATFCAKFVFEDWQHGAVKLLRLGDAHAVHLEPMMLRPDLEKTSITPPGRKFGNLKLSGLIRTSVFSTCALTGKLTVRSRMPPSESENSAQSFKSLSATFGSKAASTPGSKYVTLPESSVM